MPMHIHAHTENIVCLICLSVYSLSLSICIQTDSVLYTLLVTISLFLSFILFLFISPPRYHLDRQVSNRAKAFAYMYGRTRLIYVLYLLILMHLCIYCHTKLNVYVCLFFVHKPIHMEYYRFKMWIEYLSSLFLYVI